MDKIIKLESVSQCNSKRGQETLHPLVSVLDQSKSIRIQAYRYLSELYVIFLKDVKCEEMTYGRNHYDYQEETMMFNIHNISPAFSSKKWVIHQMNIER